MPKSVPRYLKEISTNMSGHTEGDYADEWDPAGSPYQHEEHPRSSWQAKSGNYLGWWGRGGRGVYYFGEHQRPSYFQYPESYFWDAYDWYKTAATKINAAFSDEAYVEKILLEHPDLFSEKNLEERVRKDTVVRLPLFPVPNIPLPDDIRNVKGIHAWLMNRYATTRHYLQSFNSRAEKFNSALKAIKSKIQEEEAIKIKNFKKAMEDEKYNNVVTQLGNLSNKINILSDKFDQFKVDKNKEFSLFKSDLTSKIPDTSINVGRLEHDEDIALINETLNSIKKGIKQNEKKTDDSIARLQKSIKLSYKRWYDDSKQQSRDIQRIDRSTDFFLNYQKQEINDLREDQGAQLSKIDDLRKDLQALGGEARTFIDNTNRQKQAKEAKVAKRENVVTRTVKKAAFPDLTKRPWLKGSVTGRFFQLVNQW